MRKHDDATLRERIALHACLRYCDRGCTPGGDLDDWLAAEREVLAEKEKRGPQEKAGQPRRRRERRTSPR